MARKLKKSKVTKNVRLLLMAFPGSENVVPIEINERLFMLVESVDGNETELLNFEFFDSLYLLGLVMNLIQSHGLRIVLCFENLIAISKL